MNVFVSDSVENSAGENFVKNVSSPKLKKKNLFGL